MEAQDIRDANVLPRGVGVFVIGPSYATGLERFGPGGLGTARENLLADVNGIDLTRIIAGDDSATLETVLGGSLGVTNFDGSQHSFGFDFILGYGVTDRLTLVGLVSYSRTEYKLDAWLTEGDRQSNARVLPAADIACPGGELQIDRPEDLLSIVDLNDDTYKFNVGDLRRVLVSQCLGYKDPFNLGVSRGSDGLLHGRGEGVYAGFRDMAVGAKYRLYHTERIGVAALSYVLFPTGKVEDPDDLFDINFGDGQWDTALLLATTVNVTDRLSASFTTGYEVQFADTLPRRLFGVRFTEELEDDLAEMRVTEEELFDRHLDDADLVPLVPRYDTAVVSRNLGDNYYAYLGLSYQIFDWLGFGLNLDYLYHFRDSISDTGRRVEDGTRFESEEAIRADVDALIASGELDPENKTAELRARLANSSGRKAAAYAWHTIRQQVLLRAGIGFNTIAWFLKGEFPVPFFLSLGASYNLAGHNIDANDSVGLSLGIPFVTTGDVKDPREYGYDDEPGGGLPWP